MSKEQDDAIFAERMKNVHKKEIAKMFGLTEAETEKALRRGRYNYIYERASPEDQERFRAGETLYLDVEGMGLK